MPDLVKTSARWADGVHVLVDILPGVLSSK